MMVRAMVIGAMVVGATVIGERIAPRTGWPQGQIAQETFEAAAK